MSELNRLRKDVSFHSVETIFFLGVPEVCASLPSGKTGPSFLSLDHLGDIDQMIADTAVSGYLPRIGS